ncbi:MAG: YceD family protein [Xanthomonadales bacterium]|nr:YceD family protein [Xanthomonadales bacterium]
MPLKRLERLTPLLAPVETGSDTAAASADNWPDARFSATFGHDSQGMVVIDLQVEARLPLLCQRSLEPYFEPVERHSVLTVVRSVAEQELVPEHYEPVLAEQGRLALQDLVEDELLLAVPQVPRNPESAAVRRSTEAGGGDADAGGGRGSGDAAEPTHKPFEGLAELMKARKG